MKKAPVQIDKVHTTAKKQGVLLSSLLFCQKRKKCLLLAKKGVNGGKCAKPYILPINDY